MTTILYLMSMTECARAPFSLVDEINQVRDAVSVSHRAMLMECMCDEGHGSTRRARGAQRARQDDMHGGQRTVFLDHPETSTRFEVRSADEGSLR